MPCFDCCCRKYNHRKACCRSAAEHSESVLPAFRVRKREGRVKIGISGIAVTSDQASNYNIPQGIYVQSIVSGGPCDGTSLKKGDIITEVDGETITSFADVYAILETHKPGDKIKVKYYSSSSGDGEVEITLQEDK